MIQEQGFIDYYSQWLLITEHSSLSAILTHITNIHNVDAIVLRPGLDNVNLGDFIDNNLSNLKYEIEDIVIGRSVVTCASADCLYMNVVSIK